MFAGLRDGPIGPQGFAIKGFAIDRANSANWGVRAARGPEGHLLAKVRRGARRSTPPRRHRIEVGAGAAVDVVRAVVKVRPL